MFVQQLWGQRMPKVVWTSTMVKSIAAHVQLLRNVGFTWKEIEHELKIDESTIRSMLKYHSKKAPLAKIRREFRPSQKGIPAVIIRGERKAPADPKVAALYEPRVPVPAKIRKLLKNGPIE